MAAARLPGAGRGARGAPGSAVVGLELVPRKERAQVGAALARGARPGCGSLPPAGWPDAGARFPALPWERLRPWGASAPPAPARPPLPGGGAAAAPVPCGRTGPSSRSTRKTGSGGAWRTCPCPPRPESPRGALGRRGLMDQVGEQGRRQGDFPGLCRSGHRAGLRRNLESKREIDQPEIGWPVSGTASAEAQGCGPEQV